MAGSFGFEEDKYEVSVAVGEHSLLPAVRKEGLSTLIVADGFSCREQISQHTGRHALHLAEVLRLGQNGNKRWMYPEGEIVSNRKKALRRAKVRAVATLAGVGLGAVLLAKALRNR